MSRKWLLSLLIIVLVAGCDYILPKKQAVEKPNVQEVAAAPIRGLLLAQVGDWAIGTDDFKDRLDTLKLAYPEADITNIDTKKVLLNTWVNEQALALEAKSRGLDKDSTVAQAVKDFQRKLLAEKLSEDITKDVIVTDAEIEQFYQDNQLAEGIREPEERKVKEIVVSSKSEANSLMARIYQGESFATIAEIYSVAESKDKGGDLGFIRPDPDKKFQKFWAEVLTKEKGQMSSPFMSPEGQYYIILVEDIKGGKIKDLDEVKDDIKKALEFQKVRTKLSNLIDSAKQKFKFILNEDLL